MDVQTQKAIVIEQFKRVNDINLINAVKNLLDYALKKEEEIFIPETHRKLVIERLNKVRENPERLLEWDEVKKTLISE